MSMQPLIIRSLALATIWVLLVGPNRGLAQRTYASHSVLATGTWHRMAILREGVYKLDYAYFQSIGLNPATIDPRQIHIHGDGGGALPQANATPRHDDLPEAAIWVQGEADGVFDPGDYVLFFAGGPHTWTSFTGKWAARHLLHPYTDTTFYFLTVNNTAGKRISDAAIPAGASSETALVQPVFHEREWHNPIESGRVWLGELFDFSTTTTQTISLYTPAASAGDSVQVRIRMAAASEKTSSFAFSINGQAVGSLSMGIADIYGDGYAYVDEELLVKLPANSAISGDSLRIAISYNKNGSSIAQGWLDWIEVLYETATANTPSQTPLLLNPGQVVQFPVPAGASVWNVSNPVAVTNVPVTNQLAAAGSTVAQRLWLHQGNYFSPAATVSVTNQDLHGLDSDYDLVIVSNPLFLAQAERLATMHREHLHHKVCIATPRQIYNEFGSGEMDVTAIRDFIKMFYDRSNFVRAPHVLLLGDGSYDPREVLTPNKGFNFVPTYQARQGAYRPGAFTCDDFLVLLDENEGQWGEGSGLFGDTSIQTDQMDTGVGRIPVNSEPAAAAVVDKIIAYATNPASYGSWRNRLLLVADHKDSDGSVHAGQADNLSTILQTEAPCVNVDKIYMDNYQLVSSAGDYTFPEGKTALLDALDKGALVVNYTGHGGEQTWSQGKILTNTDIDQLSNGERMPLFITATCEFGRFDDPAHTSGAELLAIRGGGGAIAAITSVRLVYSDANANFNKQLYYELFDLDPDGNLPLLGDIYAKAKNNMYKSSSYSNINTRNFALLGDPALPLAYPTLQAQVAIINGNPVDQTPDTLASLSTVTFSGQISSLDGQPATDFDGEVEVVIFDKPGQYTTNRRPMTFTWQNSRLFSGTSTVTDGIFSGSFVVPIDISYSSGLGKISLYAYADTVDAGGCYQNLYFGGTDTLTTPDDTPPVVQVFINDSLWQDGGITNPEPMLYGVVTDNSGINTVRSSIGHEIKASFNSSNTELILNDQFQYDSDSHTRGSLRYRLRDFTNGTHTVTLQAWDNANNAGSASTTFTISDNNQLVLTELLCFPNPLVDKTTFRIGSNRAGRTMRAEVDIFTLTGAQVRHLETTLSPEGNAFEDLTWSGDTEAGASVPKGIYVYRVTLTDIGTGESAADFQRIVVLR